MSKLHSQTTSLLRQVEVEVKLFWRSREAVYLNFLIPMLGMALFVYLHREGLLEKVFGLLFRGLGGEAELSGAISPVVLMTTGLITYCLIAAAFEGPVPVLVRQRAGGILKRLGGTPLRKWAFLIAKMLSALTLVFVETALILVVGMVSSDVVVVGRWWLLGAILALGTFSVAALGFIVSSVVASADAAIVAVHAIYIPMLFLCGAFLPVDALPPAFQVVARVLPLTYFVEPFRSVMVEGTDLAANAGDLLILLVWTVGEWILALRTFRWE